MKNFLLKYICLGLTTVALALPSACTGVTSNPTEIEPRSPIMVATANPHATKAGLEVLRSGGSAVDAAVAIAAVLSLVEPQSSGLAGGAFMVHFENDTKTVAVYDGRETAPGLIDENLFIGSDGKALGYFDAKNSGLSTGVPGAVAMLSLAHAEHGSLQWSSLFESAEHLAMHGFEISPRLHGMIELFSPYIPKTIDEGPTDAWRYFYDANGQPRPVGYLLKNPEYVSTLETIASDPDNFYQGKLAADIVSMVGQSPRAGRLSLDDMANYQAIKREAVCMPYREMQLCGPPPPSSWVTVGHIMGLLDVKNAFSADGANDSKNWALFADAQRLAYADRDQYVADNDHVPVPLSGMMNPDYIDLRASLVNRGEAIPAVSFGNPWQFDDSSLKTFYGIDRSEDTPGTSHFVVVDAEGNVVSMTATVESVFGSTRMVGGMFLNNELTDFSRQPYDVNGKLVANAPGPDKRPRSSMTPTIVLDDQGEFLMATGSPGGSNIIAYVAKSLIGVLDWGLTPQQAAALPNVVARGKVVRVEANTGSEALISDLESMGFTVDGSRGENSGLSIVLRHKNGTLEGGVDPRREGVVGDE